MQTHLQTHLTAQTDYYRPVTDKVMALQMQLRLGKGLEITKITTPKSEIKIAVKIPIDDDSMPENGRADMIDTFTLSGDGRRVIDFNRQFKWNKLGPSALWKKRVNALGGAHLPYESLQQKFVDQVLTKPEVLARIKAVPEAFQFMRDSKNAIQQGLGDNQMLFYAKDPRSFATVEKLEKGYKVKFFWVMDNDEQSQNGRFIMEDQFDLDENKNFKSHLRQWRRHPDSKRDDATLTSLYGVSKPPSAKAKAFVEAILPTLFESALPVAEGEPSPNPETVQIGPVTVTEPASKVSMPNEGTGKSVEVGGPHVREDSREDRVPVKGKDFTWTFSNQPSLERNTDLNNGGARIKNVIGANVRKQLQDKAFEGTLRLRFIVEFNGQTGHVAKVSVKVEQVTDGTLDMGKIRSICSDAAVRIQKNLRATPSLASKILESPQIFQTQ
jgi:hypothetical protein